MNHRKSDFYPFIASGISVVMYLYFVWSLGFGHPTNAFSYTCLMVPVLLGVVMWGLAWCILNALRRNLRGVILSCLAIIILVCAVRLHERIYQAGRNCLLASLDLRELAVECRPLLAKPSTHFFFFPPPSMPQLKKLVGGGYAVFNQEDHAVYVIFDHDRLFKFAHDPVNSQWVLEGSRDNVLKTIPDTGLLPFQPTTSPTSSSTTSPSLNP